MGREPSRPTPGVDLEGINYDMSKYILDKHLPQEKIKDFPFEKIYKYYEQKKGAPATSQAPQRNDYD